MKNPLLCPRGAAADSRISTAAGVRSPLARVADQVFLDLSLELNARIFTR